MDVNYLHKAIWSPATKLIGAVVIAFFAVFVLAAFMTDRTKGEVISKRVNIAVRAIGHDLLLRAGDSTSAVPPVIEKSKGVFLLEFQNEFIFQPDTLVAVVQRMLAKTGLSNYTVTVYECHKSAIVYGFEINPPDNSIMSCLGRVQPKACYNIEIAFADFPDPNVSHSPLAMMFGGLVIVIAVVVIGKNFTTKKPSSIAPANNQIQNENELHVTLGRFEFNSANQKLTINDEAIPLTDKESKILTLLHRNIGQLTLREDLIQEVWTEEGVITGRSLDVFISKLRKKLSTDPDIRITNVHGKGYRLEIVNDTVAS